MPRGPIGVVPTSFSTRGPKTVPQVDWERIFVLNDENQVLGEYVLNDDSPVESADLTRSIPLSGLRHLVSFYQGEYAFTPFRVDNLWFVLLTRGVPRIEERGSIGTLLAAARLHIPPAIDPVLARREHDLMERELAVQARETALARREQRTNFLEAELIVAATRLRDIEADVRDRENTLSALRDYAVEIQKNFSQRRTPTGRNDPPERSDSSP